MVRDVHIGSPLKLIWNPADVHRGTCLQVRNKYLYSVKRSNFLGSFVSNNLICDIDSRLRRVSPVTSPKEVNLNLIRILLKEVKLKMNFQQQIPKHATKTRIVSPKRMIQFKHKVDIFLNVFAKI